LQAGVVAAPRALDPALAGHLKRVRGRGWAIVPVAGIVGVIFAIRFASSTATWLTYLSLVAVPLLGAAALGRLARGARLWLIPLVAVLFLLAWRTPGSLVGEGSGALLSGLSCVSLGVLLAAVTPSRWLKLGIIAMACADVWLIASDQLQAPNDVLTAAKRRAAAAAERTVRHGDAGLWGPLRRRPAGRRLRTALVPAALGRAPHSPYRGALRPAVPGL
jgi:hypothetical protein